MAKNCQLLKFNRIKVDIPYQPVRITMKRMINDGISSSIAMIDPLRDESSQQYPFFIVANWKS